MTWVVTLKRNTCGSHMALFVGYVLLFVKLVLPACFAW